MRLLSGLAAAVFLAAAPSMAQAPVADPALRAAVASPVRSDANKARDGARHPVETLHFWGVKPGVTVLEIAPGAGWWTEILAPYAHKTGGRYVATGPIIDGPGSSDQSRASHAAFLKRYEDQAVLGKVSVVPFGTQVKGLGPDNSVDVAFTSRNVHNWMGQPGRVEAVFADLYRVVKPGGTLGVEEHRAVQMKPGATDGYVSEAYVIEAATKAGFVLDGKAEINANPKDTKDHPFGVWTLPPTRNSAPMGQPANPAFDRTKYEAIGESDRMTLRFKKPA